MLHESGMMYNLPLKLRAILYVIACGLLVHCVHVYMYMYMYLCPGNFTE